MVPHCGKLITNLITILITLHHRYLSFPPGVQTGSLYIDAVLVRSGFSGEGVINGSVIAVKTHKLPGIWEDSKFTRAVLIIRNPYDATLSDFNRRVSQSHVESAPPKSFHTGK